MTIDASVFDVPASNGTHEALTGLRSTRLSDVTPERVHWVWPGRLPAGKLVVVDGDPSVGKSTLMLELAARISTGSPMPDGADLDEPADVVLMSAEDGLADTIVPRLLAAGGNPDRVHAVTEVVEADEEHRLRPPRPAAVPDDLPLIEKLVVEKGAVLLVVDVLNAYLSGRVNSHRDQDIRRALHPLAQLADRTGAVVVVLRHLNKSGGDNALYRGGGSIGIIGAARVGMLAALDPDDATGTRRVLAVAKSNLAAMPPALSYRLVPDDLYGCARVDWLGRSDHSANQLLAIHSADIGDSDGSADAQSALRALLGDGPMWVKEALEQMASAGFSKDQARRAKDKIAHSVKVGKPGDKEQGWQWALARGAEDGTEDGEGGSPQSDAMFAALADDLPSSVGS